MKINYNFCYISYVFINYYETINIKINKFESINILIFIYLI